MVGFGYLKGMHLNDAMKILGSHVDRHTPLGEGMIGMECFRYIMQDARFDGIPLILETPDEQRWPEEIALLKAFGRRKRPLPGGAGIGAGNSRHASPSEKRAFRPDFSYCGREIPAQSKKEWLPDVFSPVRPAYPSWSRHSWISAALSRTSFGNRQRRRNAERRVAEQNQSLRIPASLNSSIV